jgi:aquaporin related protein
MRYLHVFAQPSLRTTLAPPGRGALRRATATRRRAGPTRKEELVVTTGRAAAAEFVGTFAIVFLAAGSLLYGADVVGVALAYGLAVAAMVSVTVPLSGGVFNPAIQVALWVTGTMSTTRSALYLVAQLTGAAAAAFVLKWVAGPVFEGVAGTSPAVPAVAPGLAAGKAVVVEALLTFFVVWAYLATVADDHPRAATGAGLAVGFTVTAGAVAALSLTGAAMNPARWFGPALAGADWTNWWVWIVGPLAGGVIAGVGSWFLFRHGRDRRTP